VRSHDSALCIIGADLRRKFFVGFHTELNRTESQVKIF
jgi:hypothetical protein